MADRLYGAVLRTDPPPLTPTSNGASGSPVSNIRNPHSTVPRDAVRGTDISADAITADKINVTQLSALTEDAGTITAGLIQSADGKFVIDLGNVLQTVKDASSTLRVKLGKIGTDYGLQILNSAGQVIVDLTGLVRATPMSDGSFALLSSTSDGLKAGSSVAESAGRAINRLLAKALAGDADSLDGLPEGTTFKRILAGATDGTGKIDLNGTAWVNKILDNIGDGVTYLRLAAVNASHQAQTASIADAQIPYSKLYRGSFDNLVLDPGFEQATVTNGSDGWTTSGYSNGGGTWSIVTTNQRSGNKCAQFNPSGQTASTNLGANGQNGAPGKHIAVTQGDNIYFECWGRKVSTGTPPNVRAVLVWRDANGNQIGSEVDGATLTPTQTYQKFSVSGTAPAGAAFVCLTVTALYVAGAAELLNIDDGYARRMIQNPIVTDVGASKLGADGADLTLLTGLLESGGRAVNRLLAKALSGDADSLDGVPEGTTYKRVKSGATDGTGNLDLAGTAWVNKVLDNVADGTTYGRPLLARLSSGKPWIDFSEAIHANKNLDNIADGATWQRVSGVSGNLVQTASLAGNAVTGPKLAGLSVQLTHLTSALAGSDLFADSRNKLLNAGFESGATYWQPAAGTSIHTTAADAYSGNNCLQISASVATDCNQVDENNNSLYFEVRPGDVIKFGGFAKLVSGTGTAQVVLIGVDANKANRASLGTASTTAASWTAVSGTYTVSGTTKYVGLKATLAGPSGTATVRFDDLYIIIMTPGGDLVANSVTASQIASRTIVANNIFGGTITANEIASRTILAGNIVSGTITGNEIAGRTILAGNIVSGTLTTNEIASRTILAGNVVAGTLTGNEIASRTVAAGNIVAGTITSNEIAGQTILAGNIAAGAIGTTQLAAGAVVAGKLLVADLTNLVQDPTFAGPSVGWASTRGSILAISNAAVPTTNAPTNVGNCFELPMTTASHTDLSPNDGTGTTKLFPVTPGETYYVSAWLATDSGAAADSWTAMGLKFADSSTGLNTGSWTAPSSCKLTGPSQGWTHVEGFVTVPSGRYWAQMWATAQAPTTTGGNGFVTLPRVRKSAGTTYIEDGAITAAKITVSNLSSISANIGTITAGLIEDSSAAHGVVVSGTVPAAFTRYLNLVDSSKPFLKHDNLSLNWDGSASFGGSLSANDIAMGSQSGFHATVNNWGNGFGGLPVYLDVGTLENQLTVGAQQFQEFPATLWWGATSNNEKMVAFGDRNYIVAGSTYGPRLAFRAYEPVAARAHIFSEQFDNGTKTTSFTLDWSKGNSQRVVLGASLTITMTNMRPGGVYTLEVVQDTHGSRTVTWAISAQSDETVTPVMAWSNGAAPVLTTTANKADIISFLYDGIPSTRKLLGFVSGLNFTV